MLRLWCCKHEPDLKLLQFVLPLRVIFLFQPSSVFQSFYFPSFKPEKSPNQKIAKLWRCIGEEGLGTIFIIKHFRTILTLLRLSRYYEYLFTFPGRDLCVRQSFVYFSLSFIPFYLTNFLFIPPSGKKSFVFLFFPSLSLSLYATSWKAVVVAPSDNIFK